MCFDVFLNILHQIIKSDVAERGREKHYSGAWTCNATCILMYLQALTLPHFFRFLAAHSASEGGSKQLEFFTGERKQEELKHFEPNKKNAVCILVLLTKDAPDLTHIQCIS